MKKLFLLLLLASNFIWGQETEFKFSKERFTDYVVIDCPGKTQAELYKKAVEWVMVNYKNPNEVLKAKIENDYFRINGFSRNLLCFNGMGKTFYDAEYQIEVSFKDGKYKFDVVAVSLLNTKSDPKIELQNMSEYYKEDGKIRGTYKYFPEVFPVFFNDLNKSLKDFIISGGVDSKKSDW